MQRDGTRFYTAGFGVGAWGLGLGGWGLGLEGWVLGAGAWGRLCDVGSEGGRAWALEGALQGLRHFVLHERRRHSYTRIIIITEQQQHEVLLLSFRVPNYKQSTAHCKLMLLRVVWPVTLDDDRQHPVFLWHEASWKPLDSAA